MANMSDKNFPHAHGAGRVVAAFSLAHPGGPRGYPGAGGPADGASEMIMPPPLFRLNSLAVDHPYSEPITTGDITTWTPNRQPYNATSWGVYVTGSGTRRLPYRTALGLEVPADVSPSISTVFPTSGLYPFELVDRTEIGSTHGQVVCSVVGEEPEVSLGQLAYYEVGLNWDLPLYKATIQGFPSAEVIESTWENYARASFERALLRTFWVTASLSSNAQLEAHPEALFDTGGPAPISPRTQNLSRGYVGGTIANIENSGNSAYAAPYDGNQIPVNTPSSFPWSLGDEDDFNQFPCTIQTQLSAIPTSIKITQNGAVSATLEVSAAPIIRVWVCLPARPAPSDTALKMAPRPMPRVGLNPYLTQTITDELGTIIPGVNVQVVQKNSSAVDGTDNGIYDLYEGYTELPPPSEPITRERRTTPIPDLSRILRKKDSD